MWKLLSESSHWRLLLFQTPAQFTPSWLKWWWGESLGQIARAPFAPLPPSPGHWGGQRLERVGGTRLLALQSHADLEAVQQPAAISRPPGLCCLFAFPYVTFSPTLHSPCMRQYYFFIYLVFNNFVSSIRWYLWFSVLNLKHTLIFFKFVSMFFICVWSWVNNIKYTYAALFCKVFRKDNSMSRILYANYEYSFLLRSGTGQRCSLLPLLFKIVLQVES